MNILFPSQKKKYIAIKKFHDSIIYKYSNIQDALKRLIILFVISFMNYKFSANFVAFIDTSVKTFSFFPYKYKQHKLHINNLHK